MAILQEDDPRVGCLAVPISALGGFVMLALVVAAIGAGAGAATFAGVLGAVAGGAAALVVLKRASRDIP